MNLFLILGLFLSALIGLFLGLVGGGGSIVTVPILVYALGVEPHDAVGMSLTVVGGTSLVAAGLHHRRGALRLRTGLTFGVSGILGAFAGSPLTQFLSPAALLMTFAFLMLLIGVLMLRRKPDTDREATEMSSHFSLWKALLAGFGVGVLTGFLGVGGGFLIVPALVMFGGLSMKDAIGTSLFVIFLNCVAGFVGHASQNGLDWGLTALVTIVAVTGTVFGTLLSHSFDAKKLQKGFAICVLAVAVFLMAKNYTVVLGG